MGPEKLGTSLSLLHIAATFGAVESTKVSNQLDNGCNQLIYLPIDNVGYSSYQSFAECCGQEETISCSYSS